MDKLPLLLMLMVLLMLMLLVMLMPLMMLMLLEQPFRGFPSAEPQLSTLVNVSVNVAFEKLSTDMDFFGSGPFIYLFIYYIS